MVLLTVAMVALGYLLGSVPFGLVFARTFAHVDPRTAGSGNVGATNVARLCGKPLGAATLVCDVLKGAAPVSLALWLGLGPLALSAVALAAVLGHLHSCFLGFRGGKAVSTTIGVFAPLAFWQLACACGVCLLVIALSGFVSLGSLALVVCFCLLLLLSGAWTYIPAALVVSALVIYSHRENIRRLLQGTEKPWQRKRYQESGEDPAPDAGNAPAGTPPVEKE